MFTITSNLSLQLFNKFMYSMKHSKYLIVSIMKLKQDIEKNNKNSAAIMMIYLIVLVAFAIIIT